MTNMMGFETDYLGRKETVVIYEDYLEDEAIVRAGQEFDAYMDAIENE